MKRTPIISVGQVYLHTDMNEYLVVTKSTRGNIVFKGNGFSGMHEVDAFLERFGPVDPVDLDETDTACLSTLCSKKLLVGWVHQEGDEYDEDTSGCEV